MKETGVSHAWRAVAFTVVGQVAVLLKERPGFKVKEDLLNMMRIP